MRRLIVILAFLFATQPALAVSPFASWAAVVVAGDWQQHNAPSWSFDYARRDIATALVSIGFEQANIRQFSSRPEWLPEEQPPKTSSRAVRRALNEMVGQGRTGCLFYLSTHGRKDGTVWLGEYTISPNELRDMLDSTCGARPTIVVISACYSGAFIPALQTPQRYVLTAARADRQSLRCGARKYPEFDGCFLEALPGAHDFIALAQAAQACIARREHEGQIAPPSEPQLFVGDVIAPLLRQAAFEH